VDLLEDMVDGSGGSVVGLSKRIEKDSSKKDIAVSNNGDTLENGQGSNDVARPQEDRPTVDPMPNLIIRERPISNTLPQPPSFSPYAQPSPPIPANSQNPDIEFSTPHPPEPLKASSSSLIATAGSRRTAQQSLLATPSKLTTSILAQSRQMGPIPQLPPDEEDDEMVDLPTGAEFGLDWGDDEDLDGLFADMRLGLAEMREGEK